MSIKLSVLIPTFNRADYLKECLNSVLSNDYENMEVIVSDNASEDSTPEVVKSFKDKRLKYFRNKENIGDELNTIGAIKKATGDYIFFLTDDDFLNEAAIPKTIQILEKHHDVGVVMSRLNILDDSTNQLQEDYSFHNTDVLFKPGEDALSSLFRAAHVLSRITMKRDLIDMQGLQKHISSSYPQMYLVGYALKKAPAFYTDTALVTHRVNNISYWDYTEDYMTRKVVDIIKDLTADEEYGQRVKNKLIKPMIRRSYLHLLWRREKSLKDYFKYVSACMQVPEFKTSVLFWIYTITILCMGSLVRVFSPVLSFFRIISRSSAFTKTNK